MRNAIAFFISSILLIFSIPFARDKTIPLVWKPGDDLSHYSDLKIGRLSELRVKIDGIHDLRTNRTEIGKNTEKSEERLYLTDDNVSSWATDEFVSVMKQLGINVVQDRPDIILDVGLVRFYVSEGSTYKGDVAFKISASSAQKEPVWTGIASGNSSRWGSSFSPENYYECIGNAFLSAISEFLKNESFMANVDGFGQFNGAGPNKAGVSQSSSIKKRIAVFDFADKSDHQVRWWRPEQELGQGLADMCVTALVRSGKYTVIEREKLEQILKEQALGASGAITEQSATQIGKLLGVEIALFGVVTEYGFKKQNTGGNGPVPTPFGTVNIQLGVNTLTARVGVNIRLVNTTTGEIVASETIFGEETNTGISVAGAGTSFQNQAAFDESLIGKAARKAADNLVPRIDRQIAAVKWHGNIIKANESEVIINAGSASGMAIGDTLTVFAKGEELVDPVTGANLGSDEKRLGMIQVLADIADGNASKCIVVSGSGGQRGDIVRFCNIKH